MKTLVVYDSVYGNTEQVARAIGGAIEGDVVVLKAAEAGPAVLEGIDLLLIGAPTQGGRPTVPVQEFLKKISGADVKDKNVAAFDTRIPAKWVTIFGYAAGKIAKDLQKKGANLVLDPEPFFVKGTKGPLRDGELERAAAWAKDVIKGVKQG